MDVREAIWELTESFLKEDIFLVDVIISGRKGNNKVLVILDGDKGVTIENCSSLSRSLSAALDESNLELENYTLEVSTPGVDHPLKLKRQYVKNVGRNFKIHVANQQVIKGKLVEASEEHIILEQEVKQGKQQEVKRVEIPFDQIQKAMVQVSFK